MTWITWSVALKKPTAMQFPGDAHHAASNPAYSLAPVSALAGGAIVLEAPHVPEDSSTSSGRRVLVVDEVG
jgi:hypothetical protein